MTTKEYLSQVYLLSVRVRTKQQQAAELRNNISGVSGIDSSGIKVQVTPTPKMQDSIDRLISLEELIAQEILELEQKKEKIVNQINRLRSPLHIQILKMRYIDFLGWEKIAKQTKYSTRQIYRLHQNAIREFQERNKI